MNPGRLPANAIHWFFPVTHEGILEFYLSRLATFDFESDCVHGSLCMVWSDPLEVFVCDVCGMVSCPDFRAGTDLERELTRPFRDAWS